MLLQEPRLNNSFSERLWEYQERIMYGECGLELCGPFLDQHTHGLLFPLWFC